MLGSGIFVLPGLAAAKTGPTVWIAYLVAGFCVLPAALSKAELGTAMPTSGGSYVYLDRTFGPLVGTISGLGLWLSLLLKSSFALAGFGTYLTKVVGVPEKPVALGVLGLIVAVNVIGAHGVSRVQKIITSVTIVTLLVLMARGMWGVAPPQLQQDEFTAGVPGFIGAVAFVIISFAGVTKVAAIAEEVRRPERNLPAGILVSLLVVMLLYSLVAFVLVSHVPMKTLGKDLHPIYTLGLALAGPLVAKGLAVIGAITMASMATAGLLAASRFPFAMSRDRLLPSMISRISERFSTPLNAILLSGLFMAIAISLFKIERIAKLASAFMIMMFAAECLSVIVLREAGVQWYKPGFKSPWYPWIQLFGVISGVLLLVALGPLAALALVSIAAPGLLLYLFYSRRRASRSGVLFQRARRTDLIAPSPPVAVAPSANAMIEEHAPVVIALFGNERSPEILVEIGAGLADGGHLEVVYLSEIPEQTLLELAEEDPVLQSVRRRIEAMAQMRQLDIRFVPVATHDIAATVHELSNQVHCDWLVIEWMGRPAGTFMVSNPLGWIKNHLNANLANFHDAGVRYIKKILVNVEPGSHDTLVVNTAHRLAQVHDAELTFACFVPDSAPQKKVDQERAYLEQMQSLCPHPSELVIVRGKIAAAALGKTSAAYDLLLTAEAPESSFLSRVLGTVSDRLTETAVACSVLRVQSPRQRVHDTVRPSEQPQSLVSFLRDECLQAQLPKMKKERLFQTFASAFAKADQEVDPDKMLSALWERERAQNTMLAPSVAMPHASISELGFTRLGVFTTEEPIDYGNAAGVDVFFVTIGDPIDRGTHLRLLSELSKVLTKTNLLDKLREAKDTSQLRLAIVEASAQIATNEPPEPSAVPPVELSSDAT